MAKLYFGSDYQQAAHPDVMARLASQCTVPFPGYGTDEVCEAAKAKIRAACQAPADCAVYFLVGGTQTNATVIDALLKSYQGVLAAETGHIAVHEAGAIEFGGHKVLPLKNDWGKISAAQVREACETYYGDDNRDHMVMPGMVYISQPTEYGTLYSLSELEALHEVCAAYHLPLYVDGARLAYALACRENDVTLPDLARLCDAFYIGGTKCGALFGEAVVFPNPDLVPHFFTIVKQHGALLAKGFLLGMQYDALFTDDLYLRVGQAGMRAADRLRAGLRKLGIREVIPSPTNQIFIRLENEAYKRLSEKAEMSFWSQESDGTTTLRLATCHLTTDEEIDALIELLSREAEHAAR